MPSVCLSVSCSPLLAATGQGREEQASTEGEGETDDRDRVQAGAGGKVLSMEKGRGGPGGAEEGGAAGPQDSPAEARSSRGVKILRQPPPRAGGVLETTMASRGTGTAGRAVLPATGVCRVPYRSPQVLSWEAECCWTSPPSE